MLKTSPATLQFALHLLQVVSFLGQSAQKLVDNPWQRQFTIGVSHQVLWGAKTHHALVPYKVRQATLRTEVPQTRHSTIECPVGVRQQEHRFPGLQPLHDQRSLGCGFAGPRSASKNDPLTLHAQRNGS